MGLTRRDLSATVLMAAIIGIYAAYLQDTSGFIISSTRATAAVVLVLGAAVCDLGQAEDLYRRRRRYDAMAVIGVLSSMLGVIALIAAVVGIATGSASALETLVGASVALWLTATLRHAFTTTEPPDGVHAADLDRGDGRFEVPTDADFPPEDTARGPRTHEVIEPAEHHHDAPIR